MHTVRTFKFPFLFLLMFVLAAGSALAGQVVEAPVTVGFTATDWPNGSSGNPAYTIGVPQFNTNLGTLVSVGLTLTANIQSEYSLSNSAAGQATIYEYTDTMDVAVVDPSVVNPPYTSFSVTGSQGPGGTSYVYAAPSIVNIVNSSGYPLPAGDTLASNSSGAAVLGGTEAGFGASATQTEVLTDSADLTTFSAPGGGTLTLPVYAADDLLAYVSGGNLVLSQSTNAQLQLTVTYNYSTPAPTPEPATLFLFGGALLTLGLLKRRK